MFVLPEFFIHVVGVVLNKGWIRKFQVIQETYNHAHLLIALADPVDSPDQHFNSSSLGQAQVT